MLTGRLLYLDIYRAGLVGSGLRRLDAALNRAEKVTIDAAGLLSRLADVHAMTHTRGARITRGPARRRRCRGAGWAAASSR